MSKVITYACNCGCKATVTNPHQCGWLVLDQLPVDEHGLSPKLRRPLHFKTLNCLQKWVKAAVAIAPQLQETASSLSPRGMINDLKVPDLYV